jgi:tRNA(Ile)-lysidine synthase
MAAAFELNTTLMPAGLRLAVGLSGGADSVALLRALAEQARTSGWVLHAAHLHHGLRGDEADGDQAFCRTLAESLGIVFHTTQVDTSTEAKRAGEGIEEAARRLRYVWFRELMASGVIDAVATAHTRDDQAETVLGKLLRGAWTEGIAGIHPVVEFAEGRILRPMLAVSRVQIEAWLREIGQGWREDSSNRESTFTRNRIRHELLPELELWNPQIRNHLAQMAELARDEEAWWQSELARLEPEMLLSGRPVRGGGRAGGQQRSIALDVVRLASQPIALQRRLLRRAVAKLDVALSFEATESLRLLALGSRTGKKLSLPGPLTAERTPRELRLSPGSGQEVVATPGGDDVVLEVPGKAAAFGWLFQAESPEEASPATIRAWRSGDRVTLRYSSGPRKVKEVLERLKIYGSERACWPVIEWQGRIVWMQGVSLEPVAGAAFTAEKA